MSFRLKRTVAKAHSWWPAGLRNDHAGPLNAEVHRIFSGIYSGDGGAALAALLSSDEPMDDLTRAVVVAALEAAAAGNKNAIRLKFVRASDGTKPIEANMEVEAKRLAIVEAYERFRAEGQPKQKAYQSIISAKLANSDKTIDNARKRIRETSTRIRMRPKPQSG